MQLKRIFLATIIAFTINPAFADSNWTSTHGNAGHTGYVEMKTNPSYYKELWSQKLASPGIFQIYIYGSLIIKNHLIYLIDEYKEVNGSSQYVDTRLVTFEASTGKIIWETKLEKASYNLRYANGKILVISEKQLSAYDPHTGKLVNSFALNLPVDGKVTLTPKYLEVDDYNMFSIFDSDHALTYRIMGSTNVLNGKTIWQTRRPDSKINRVDELAVNRDYMMAVFSDSIDFYSRDNGELDFSVDTTGVISSHSSIVLDTNTNSAYVQYTPERNPPDYKYTLYALDLAKNGSIKWRVDNQSRSITPVVADDEVYSVDDDRATLRSFNATTGRIIWQWKPDGGDHIEIQRGANPSMLATSDTMFVVGGKFTYAISRLTHQTVWKVAKVGGLSLGDNKLFIKDSGEGEDWRNPTITAIALNEIE